jgi:site-specific recombinase XerD
MTEKSTGLTNFHWEGSIEKLEGTITQTLKYAEQGKSRRTKKAYTSDMSHFSSWCEDHSLEFLPASAGTLSLYVTFLADNEFAVSTMSRRLVAISQAHKWSGFPSPTKDERFREVWRGIRRHRGLAQNAKKHLTTVDIRQILNRLDLAKLISVRDKAILLLGFAGGFRRSELVSLNVEDVGFADKGMIIHLRTSKTDQESRGRKIAIPFGRHEDTCPVHALKAWIEGAELHTGALFRGVNKVGVPVNRRLSDKAVARIVKKRVQDIGLDSSNFGAHSLRSGFATAAAQGGASERDIMRQTGHRSVETLRKYIREGNLFRSNASDKLGL